MAKSENLKTVLLNMLSSEFVIIDNPLPEGENVCGIFLLNRNLYIYGGSNWVQFDMRGNKEEEFSSTIDRKEWQILCKPQISSFQIQKFCF